MKFLTISMLLSFMKIQTRTRKESLCFSNNDGHTLLRLEQGADVGKTVLDQIHVMAMYNSSTKILNTLPIHFTTRLFPVRITGWLRIS